MPRICFVIQPFDKGPFDKRYHDVLAPAVRRAGLEPYRVDLNPAVSIPIDDIERKIKDADCCLADISIDNPNVWYEVGFAYACGKAVVLICEARTTSFPFDVRHRNILTYTTHSPSDFRRLSREITSRLRAYLGSVKSIREISSIEPTDGLMPHEMAALGLLMASRITPGYALAPRMLSNEIQKSGYTELAAALAVERLTSKGLAAFEEEMNDEGRPYVVVKITELGVEWCMENQHLFGINREAVVQRRPAMVPVPSDGDEDDYFPF